MFLTLVLGWIHCSWNACWRVCGAVSHSRSRILHPLPCRKPQTLSCYAVLTQVNCLTPVIHYIGCCDRDYADLVALEPFDYSLVGPAYLELAEEWDRSQVINPAYQPYPHSLQFVSSLKQALMGTVSSFVAVVVALYTLCALIMTYYVGGDWESAMTYSM